MAIVLFTLLVGASASLPAANCFMTAATKHLSVTSLAGLVLGLAGSSDADKENDLKCRCNSDLPEGKEKS